MSLVTRADNGSTRKTSLYDDAVVLSGHSGPVFSVKFSPDGQTIASAGMDRTIRLWNLPTVAGEEQPNYGVIEGHKGGVTSLDWDSQSKIWSTSADSTVSIWDTETGQRVKTGRGHDLTVNDCSVNNQGICLSAGDDGTVRLWDEREKHEVHKITTSYPVLGCELSRDGKIAYVSGVDPSVRVYDLSSGNLIWHCDVAMEITTGLALSSDESMLVVRAMDGAVHTVNAKAAVPKGISRNGQIYSGAVGGGAQMLQSRVRFSPDDVYICSASDDQSATMWSTASQRIVAKLAGHEAAVMDVDFHPGESVLASCDVAGDIIVREF